jgi:hypothetical protein
MPVEEERKLKARARTLGLAGERADAYVFGTLTKIEKRRKAKKVGRSPVKRKPAKVPVARKPKKMRRNRTVRRKTR